MPEAIEARGARNARNVAPSVLAGLALFACCGTVAAIDATRAVHAANVWRAYEPSDDIRHDFRASHVLAADFDRDGTDEIVYLGTATCVGAGSDCQNDIYVMTPLVANDRRIEANPLDNGFMADFWRRARATGYGNDASLHIPGEVERVAIVGRRIRVVFEAKAVSPVCLRDNPTDAPARPDACPPPGRYAWTLAWRKGEVVREREEALASR